MSNLSVFNKLNIELKIPGSLLISLNALDKVTKLLVGSKPQGSKSVAKRSNQENNNIIIQLECPGRGSNPHGLRGRGILSPFLTLH